jgi:hypothetical protein
MPPFRRRPAPVASEGQFSLTIVTHAPQVTLTRKSPLATDWIVHGVPPPAGIAQLPVQCHVEKSGGGDDWQVSCVTFEIFVGSIRHGVPTHPCDIGVPGPLEQSRQPESGASAQVRPPMHSHAQAPLTQLQDGRLQKLDELV